MKLLLTVSLLVAVVTVINGAGQGRPVPPRNYGYTVPRCRMTASNSEPKVGSTVTLKCWCSPSPKQYFIYGPDKKPFVNNKDLSFVVAENSYGTYTCWNKYQEFTFPDGELNRYVKITLRKPVPAPTVDLEITPNPTVEGTRVTFTARVNNPLVVRQYTFISPRGVRVSAPRGQNYIVISSVSILEHRGPWRVEVSGRFGEVTSVPRNLEIRPRAPRVTLLISPNSVLEGGLVTLRAYSDNASPIERYVFKRGTFSVEATVGSTSVVIRRVTRELHAGDWIVTAYGAFGQVDSNPETLVVKRQPPTVRLTIDPNPVNEGASFTLRAIIDRPTDVRVIVFSIGNVRYGAEPGSQTVVVRNARPDMHMGDWVVTIEGPFGRVVSQSVRLVVQRRPRATLFISPNPVREGLTVTLRGRIDTNAPVNKWTFVHDSIRVVAPGSQNFAVVSNVNQRDHQGMWTVIAEGPYFTVESFQVMLRVLPRPPPPTVRLIVTPVPAIEGSTVRLTVNVLGSAPWSYIVYRSGNRELRSDYPINYVDIFNVDLSYNGPWTATVYGPFGEVTTTATVVVIRREFSVHVGCDRREYVYNSNAMSQPDAARYCASKGMSLAVPGDEQELADLLGAIFKDQAPEEYWTGFKLRGSMWYDTVCHKKAYNRPAGGVGYCAVASGNKLRADGCGERKPFLCQKAACDVLYTTRQGRSSYIAITRKRSQAGAVKYCQHLGGKLLSIADMGEMEAVCRPLINMKMINIPFWTSPYAPSGAGVNAYTDACGRPIPSNMLTEAFNDKEYGNLSTERCTVLLEDLYFVRPCDRCYGFICEMPGC